MSAREFLRGVELVGSGWGREKERGVWENFSALSGEAGPEVSHQSVTVARTTFKVGRT